MRQNDGERHLSPCASVSISTSLPFPTLLQRESIQGLSVCLSLCLSLSLSVCVSVSVGACELCCYGAVLLVVTYDTDF